MGTVVLEAVAMGVEAVKEVEAVAEVVVEEREVAT